MKGCSVVRYGYLCVFLLGCVVLYSVWNERYWRGVPENVKLFVSESAIISAASGPFHPEGIITLHFVWIHSRLAVPVHGGDDEPGMISARLYAAECMRVVMGREFKLVVWTDVMVRTEFPELVHVLEKITVPSWICDILRYHILLRFGGVCFDADERMLRDFAPALQFFDFNFTVCQDPWIAPGTVTATAPCRQMATGIMAAQAGNPAVRCAAELSLSNTRWVQWLGLPHFDIEWTGPPLWSSCVQRYGQMNVLPSWTFLPCSFHSRSSCRHGNYTQYSLVFGVQEWAFSWA